MFKPVSSRVSFPQMEEAILAIWQKNKIFERSVAAREGGPDFILYDGPATVNGSPALHHVFVSVFKDVIPRYKVMKGYYAPRIAGWDTHGLPVELEVEKQLGFSSKNQIEEYGIDRFNEMCRQSVYKYLREFEDVFRRVGYWIDFDNAYITLKNEYIESCWWAIKQMWDKELVYQGYRVTPHCPRCGTSLSSHEVSQGYKENTEDPSVYIKFRVVEKSKRDLPSDMPLFFLAWTTTPWTLPGNTALAVSPDAEYILLKGASDYLVLAARLAATIKIDSYNEVKKIAGKDLVGIRYEPLFNPHDFGVDRLKFQQGGALLAQKADKNLTYPVISGDFVTMEEGTGIVHIAPAFGEVDYDAGKELGLDFVQQVNLQGKITGSYAFSGKFVKDADSLILEDLKSRGLLLNSGSIRHTYPFCWRCDSPLLYYAKTAWYIKTTAMKDRLISGNEEINWYPEHIKEGRFGDWLQNNIDWAFSRERYWGTPLPVWRCDSCGTFECVGGVEELKGKPGIAGLEDTLDLHRPYVDAITFSCSKCQGKMHRAPEVIDCWFDSGAMPVSQLHYPFENRELFDTRLKQADLICEAVDQTRGWFYSLHAISTLLFDRPCYKNVICLGHILDAKGEKMSKRKGNVVRPEEVVAKYGADALRWYLYTASAPGNPRQFDVKQVDEVSRRFLSTLWNVYSFFVMYANIDKYRPAAGPFPPPSAELDKWILSELNQLIADVDAALDEYNPTEAGRKIETFVDGLSNWYVRRSRRRFWKSENDDDKLSAYNTLYYCLETMTRLLAPFTPFIAEELYQNLVLSVFPDAVESVHLAGFPTSDESKIDKQLVDDNRLAMKVCSMGRSARSKAGVKVRQPLETVYVGVASDYEAGALERVSPLILEELNVKELKTDTVDRVSGMEVANYSVVSEAGSCVAISTYITVELQAEGMAREIVHRLQTMRRTAGYEIADHILMYYEGDAYFVQSISGFADYIRQETLADDIEESIPEDVDLQEEHKVSGYSLSLGIKKVK
ncbi:MAG: isoleucine--tRNA ligase [Chloroflexi bacterium RBG_13_51_18]|nr:MAG: isoleucine--tRNA ligase [Chloroflexi bacterium RBG_13_51_18]